MTNMDAMQIISQRQHYEEVVLNGICKASQSVKIATANVKNMYIEKGAKYHSILKTFEQLTLNQVQIDILHSGVPSSSFLGEIKETTLLQSPHFSMRRCPRLHFKLVLIDNKILYIGSANFTGAGMGAKSDHRRNFEIGLLTRDMPTIDILLEQFDRIWHGIECEPCQRKDNCPVPLEEIRHLK